VFSLFIGVSVAAASPAPSAPSGGSTSAEQTIELAITPGTLSVSPQSESLPLPELRVQRKRGVYSGELSPITVIDARGSLAGWTASVSLVSVTGLSASDLTRASVCLRPERPTLVAGNPHDIVRGASRSCARGGKPISAFDAAPGGGGGTYRDSAQVVLRLPKDVLATDPTVTLAVSVR
jgi:hypothetical protein